MRTLWTAERPSFAGEFYRFEDSLFFPKPAQPGGPPIWIGGNSDAAISRTATLGDAWHADEVPPDEFVVRVAAPFDGGCTTDGSGKGRGQEHQQRPVPSEPRS